MKITSAWGAYGELRLGQICNLLPGEMRGQCLNSNWALTCYMFFYHWIDSKQWLTTVLMSIGQRGLQTFAGGYFKRLTCSGSCWMGMFVAIRSIFPHPLFRQHYQMISYHGYGVVNVASRKSNKGINSSNRSPWFVSPYGVESPQRAFCLGSWLACQNFTTQYSPLALLCPSRSAVLKHSNFLPVKRTCFPDVCCSPIIDVWILDHDYWSRRNDL